MKKYHWIFAAVCALLIVGIGIYLQKEHTQKEHTQASSSSSSNASSSAGSIWGANYFPNVPLISHEGNTVQFFDDLIKDKVVAINFIFTSCPDSCPLETARLRRVQKLLGDRVGKDVFMYSVTIDPEVDTPKVLNEYAKRFRAGPGWLFLTGKEADITLIRKKFGIYIEEIQSRDSTDHNLTLIIGNQKTGRWMKKSPFENPHILATQIGNWLHNWKLPSEEKREYADAPEVRNISTGESLFRTRCASCHTIGDEYASATNKQPIGPDLLGVTLTRDRKWLVRWLKEPDIMLAEKDPLAMSLLARYNNVPMPNLRLNDVEIQALLSYIEETSLVAVPQKKEAGDSHDHGSHEH